MSENPHQKLLDLAAEFEKAEKPDRDLFLKAFRFVHELESKIDRNASYDEIESQVIANLEFTHKLQYMYTNQAYIEAAMLLQDRLVWLSPVLSYHNREVRLVNGLGLPIDGDDHCSVSGHIANALCAAWLKAHYRDRTYKEEEA